MSNGKRSSASIRRAVADITIIHKLNRHPDPTKNPNVVLKMCKVYRKLGCSCSQASNINANTLEKLPVATDDSIGGIRD